MINNQHIPIMSNEILSFIDGKKNYLSLIVHLVAEVILKNF